MPLFQVEDIMPEFLKKLAVLVGMLVGIVLWAVLGALLDTTLGITYPNILAVILNKGFIAASVIVAYRIMLR